MKFKGDRMQLNVSPRAAIYMALRIMKLLQVQGSDRWELGLMLERADPDGLVEDVLIKDGFSLGINRADETIVFRLNGKSSEISFEVAEQLAGEITEAGLEELAEQYTD